MRDLTKNSIAGHILTLAAPVAIGMFAQISYQLVNLYFIAKLGAPATAGVNAAGNVIFIASALTQVLTVSTVALVAHAVGRNDFSDANVVFNQSMTLSIVCGVVTMILLYCFIHPYLLSVAADTATLNAGTTFVLWMLPGLALMLPMAVFSSALRGIGIVLPSIAIYTLTVIINAILAPILIAGWCTGAALGVKGAGMATTLSIVIGAVLLGVYFHRLQRHMTLTPKLMRPCLKQWHRMLNIGLPAGSEFALTFLSAAVVYYAIRNFGASAQAGFGIGSRVLQSIVLPGMSIAFAAGPIAGQNFGAKNNERVRETFRKATLIGTAIMISITILVQWRPQALVGMFDADASAIAVAALFLQMMSWTFVAQGLVYTCSTMFQGLGNTVPSLISSGTRFVLFAIPALWLSTQPRFRIEQVWYLSIASVTLQAILSLWLLHMEFKRRLLPVTQ